jgi:diguanylate cyclase (GGDEF)-like protein
MTLQILDALSRLAARRFQSFAEAATTILDLLSGATPDGCVLLGQIDWEEGKCRVIDARGGGIARGAAIPLAAGVPAESASVGQLLDRDALAALCAGSWVAAPLDAPDGSVVGVLLATGVSRGAPTRLLAQMLLVAARMLSYEWESISTRAELRRLSVLARDREHTDPVTGLANRETLLTSLDREWQLTKRGTVESYLVVCRLRDRAEITSRHGEAMANLLLKDVAEALGGGARRTDHVGRVADDSLCVVLVGCKGVDGALAFLARFERALERVMAGRPTSAELSYGIQALAGTESAREALELAEVSARSATARRNVAPLDTAPAGGVG